ncbi:MAG: hypothetical protein RI947_658 [Candidatus Parcubacteria bacterium]|jgi:hypothetical protein
MDTVTIRVTSTDEGFAKIDGLLTRAGMDFRQFVVWAMETHSDLLASFRAGESLYLGTLDSLESKVMLFGIHTPDTERARLLNRQEGIAPRQRAISVEREWLDRMKVALAEGSDNQNPLSDTEIRQVFAQAMRNYTFLLEQVANGRWLYWGTVPVRVHRLRGSHRLHTVTRTSS